ncbi:hypothetical protein ACSBR2_000617 [Camellia fascicularis]
MDLGDGLEVMFLGGTGTSTVTMERVVSLLLNHPSTFQNARAEIDNHVGIGIALLGDLKYLAVRLLVNASDMHRDPKVWEEPDKFKPERFEGEREGFKFFPFGIERRACPGANMGVRAISLALGSLIQCFELEEVREKKRLDQRFKTSAQG